MVIPIIGQTKDLRPYFSTNLTFLKSTICKTLVLYNFGISAFVLNFHKNLRLLLSFYVARGYENLK